MKTFILFFRRRTDRTPLDAYGKPIRRVAGTEDAQGPARIVRGGLGTVRISAISSILADKERDDGKTTSLIQRNDGCGPLEVYDSPADLHEAIREALNEK